MKRSNIHRLWSGSLMMLVAVAGLASSALAAPPWARHVDADAAPGGDGLTWATAFNDLQAALNAANASGGVVSELWVKKGTYYPANFFGGSKASTFLIGNGIRVYGGFAGTETARTQSDPAANVTILNGTLAGLRVYHVVTMTGEDSRLSGFTVTGGRHDANQQGNGGAGVYIGGRSTIERCIITGNQLYGPWQFEGGIPARGAGVYCAPTSDLTITDTSIVNNDGNFYLGVALPTHVVYGGGIGGTDCVVRMTRCTVGGNQASSPWFHLCGGGFSSAPDAGHGGGMYFENSALTIESSTFVDNRAGKGANGATCGGVSQYGFRGTKGGSGGGVYLDGSAALLVNCVFSGNLAGNGGSGGGGASPASGGAGGSGGGIFATNDSALHIVNTTIANNVRGIGGPPGWEFPPTAVKGPDGIGAGAASEAMTRLINCIVWNGESNLALSGSSLVTYSDVQGGYPGTGNIDADPRFVSGIDLHLQVDSPAIDAGNNNADLNPDVSGIQRLPSTDRDGLPRFVDVPTVADTGAGTAPIVDMGAYERVNVTCGIDFTGDGILDFSDYLLFLSLYDAGAESADLTDDGVVDFSDYLEFLARYDGGC